MNNTHVRPSRDLRNHYAELSQLTKENNHVIITNNGKGDAVLIGFEEYKNYQEYLYNHYVEQKLAEAEKYAKRPDAVWHSEEDVMAMLRSDDEA